MFHTYVLNKSLFLDHKHHLCFLLFVVELFYEVCLPASVLSLEFFLQFGEDALKEGMQPGSNGGGGMHDLFDMLNGGGGGRRQPAGPKKGEDVVHRLNVSLKELYLGVVRCVASPRYMCPVFEKQAQLQCLFFTMQCAALA